MGHIGTLIMKDEHGHETRLPCQGGLDTYADTGGGVRVRGVVNVEGDALDEVRRLMSEARDGTPGMAWFTGEVFDSNRRDVRLVESMPVRIAGLNETGNVQVESDEVLDA